MNSGTPEPLVVVGRVTRPHGVHGEIRVRPFTQTPESFLEFRELYLGTPETRRRVIGARLHLGLVLLQFEGLVNRDQAQTLVGMDLLVPRAWLPELSDDEFYWTDLIGLTVLNQEGQTLGRVTGVLPTGSDDLLVIEDQGREILIPFRAEMVTAIDLAAGRLQVDPPPGLLDL